MGQIRTYSAPGDWLLFAILAAPHALYAYVWLFPGSWRAVFRRSPVNVFATFATALKGRTTRLKASVAPNVVAETHYRISSSCKGKRTAVLLQGCNLPW